MPENRSMISTITPCSEMKRFIPAFLSSLLRQKDFDSILKESNFESLEANQWYLSEKI